jgi:hypothetical protein
MVHPVAISHAVGGGRHACGLSELAANKNAALASVRTYGAAARACIVQTWSLCGVDTRCAPDTL